MKKAIIILATIVFCFAYAEASEFDVRNVRWGMNQEQVRIAEIEINKERPIINDKNKIIYDIETIGKKCKIVFSFDDDKLVSVQYFFETASEDDSRLLFSTLKEILEKKYGTNDDKVSESLLGDLVYVAQTSRSHISLVNKTGEDTFIILIYEVISRHEAYMKKEKNKHENIVKGFKQF